MSVVPLPENEVQRLRSLRDHEIIETAADPYLENLLRISARRLNVPIVLINLVDSERLWAKAAVGLPRGYELFQNDAFCSFTILTPGTLNVIRDTLQDARVANNPFVIGHPGFRFYAGAAITDKEGRALGTICALDIVPREFDAEAAAHLSEAAEAVSARLELYRLNAAMRESEARYRAAAEFSSDIPWTASAEGETEECAGPWLSLVGTPHEASSRRGWIRAVHPDDLTAALASWSASVTSGTPLDFECRLKLSNGGYRWFRVRATPIRDSTGRVMRWYGIVEDIHGRREAEAILQETETRLRLALDVGRLRTWELDAASRRLTASDVSVMNFGLQLGAELFEQHKPLARIYSEDEQQFRRDVQGAWLAGQELEIEHRSVWPDETVHWIRLTGRPIKDAAGKSVKLVGVSLDITAQRTAEEERQHSEVRVPYLANHDLLTVLANRRFFHQALVEAVALATADAKVTLLRIELDDFKTINGLMGPEVGDSFLQHAAGRLRLSTRSNDLLARYGIDDFAVILSGITSRSEVDVLTRRLLRSLSEPLEVNRTSQTLSGSVGISIAPDDTDSAERLLRNADTAL